jgi:acyl dehydratase
MTGRYYEEFTVGETIEHDKRRTISERDNQVFCDTTMNQQPLHLDADFAADTQFGERLVNGLLTMSLAVGLSIPETTDGTIVANLSYDDVTHPNPVFHGDTIYARSTVTEKRETSDGERGVVTMGVEAFKVDDHDPDADDEKENDPDAADEKENNHGPDDDDVNDRGDTLVCTFERTVLSLKRDHMESP